MISIGMPLRESYDTASRDLSEFGPTFMKQGMLTGDGRYGRTHAKGTEKETVRWGREIPLGDCEAQEIAIGEFHFAAVDFGDTIRVSGSIHRETQNVENREPNQCALLHPVAGTQWVRAKQGQGIPVLRKVLLEADEWRKDEISQAHHALAQCECNDGQATQELRSLSHDALNNGHGRDYWGIDVFPQAH